MGAKTRRPCGDGGQQPLGEACGPPRRAACITACTVRRRVIGDHGHRRTPRSLPRRAAARGRHGLGQISPTPVCVRFAEWPSLMSVSLDAWAILAGDRATGVQEPGRNAEVIAVRRVITCH